MTIEGIKVKIKSEIIELINSQTSIINQTQSFRQYIEKCRRQMIDNEESIVQPFTLSFLRIINYINQHNLTIEVQEERNKPDFYTEKFILECKSSKYSDFSERMGREESPKEQLMRYLKSNEFYRDYGILFSLDRFEVYKLINGNLELIENLSFSLIDFYEEQITNFENFISIFYSYPLSITEKINIIAAINREDLIPIKQRQFNKILKDLITQISIELNSRFLCLNETTDEKKLIREKICQIKKQMNLSSTVDAENEYLSQTSYIILARILLTKHWEDLELIDPPYTYNGGFRRYIQELNENIEDVYQKALKKSQDIYYLFNPNNPYLLLKISDELIINILFQLCKYNFNSLDYDILGYIYEDYLDIEHRKRFGQYYTPPYIVNLILDRVGYKPSPNDFLDESILDPASGSGTFLLNAVARVLRSRQNGQNHSLEYKRIIESNIFGSELMLFPYLISEINLLIQISPILKDLLENNMHLNVFHIFPNNSFNLIDKSFINRLFDIAEDDIKGSDLIDSAVIERKRPKLRTLQNKNDFDYIIGNPPYVANDTNPEFFREMREKFTICNKTYFNKMDLFYWFIIINILKLKPKGKLSFITTRYWLDKGERTGVKRLKEYILEYCYVREIIDLRNVNVFISAPGQENIIFILERKSETNQDSNIRIFRIQSRPLKDNCILNDCKFDRGYCINDQEYLDCLCSREDKWNELLENPNLPLSNYIKCFFSAKSTSDLELNRSWPIFYPEESTINRIMDDILSSCTNTIEGVDGFGIPYREENVVKYIKDFFVIRAGIMTTIDEVFILTPNELRIENNQFLLKIESTINIGLREKSRLINQIGGEIDNSGTVWLKLTEIEKNRLIDLYKTPSVYRHGLDVSKVVGKLIYFENERLYDNYPSLIHYLSQFRDEIEEKLNNYNELSPTRPRKWITLRRGARIILSNRDIRSLEEFYKEKPKIFYNYRVGDNNIFGFTNRPMVATTDMYFFHRFGENINIYYILAYLNSKLLSFYFKERPLELQRQKTNVENDIPIFIPRNDNEQRIRNHIINKEKKLIRELQNIESSYRSFGFHFELGQKIEDEISIDIQKYLENNNEELRTIDSLSYKLNTQSELSSINRDTFPIIIENFRNVQVLSDFSEEIENDNVVFKYRSLKFYVRSSYYEKLRMTLESYVKFCDTPTFLELLRLKIPTDNVISEIREKKAILFKQISHPTIEEKTEIEKIIDNILEFNNSQGIESIENINQILYFIDLAFIKMICSAYKDFILEY